MFKERFIPMFEADGGAGGAGDNPPTPDKGGDDDKPMTLDEFLALSKDNQAEFDRRMSKGIKTAIDNEKKRIDEIVDDRISEAERLAKMTEMERQKYEQDKRDAELKKREEEINRRELQAQAMATLAEKGLPASYIELVDCRDAESCNKSIATIEKVHFPAVTNGIEEKLKGRKPPKAPKDDGGNADEELAKQVREAMARTNRLI